MPSTTATTATTTTTRTHIGGRSWGPINIVIVGAAVACPIQTKNKTTTQNFTVHSSILS